LGHERWVCLWADGIDSGLRAEDERLSALVVIGVNERSQKRFLALEEGYPATRHQRCQVHKIANVLNYLPKAEQAIAQI
jgi:transposase-like protein